MGLNKSDFKSLSEIIEQRNKFYTHADSILIFKFFFKNFLSWCDKLRLVKLKQKMQNCSLFGPYPEYVFPPVCGKRSDSEWSEEHPLGAFGQVTYLSWITMFQYVKKMPGE